MFAGFLSTRLALLVPKTKISQCSPMFVCISFFDNDGYLYVKQNKTKTNHTHGPLLPVIYARSNPNCGLTQAVDLRDPQ